MFDEHFIAAHQQVGDFEVVKVEGRVKKNGGNVASYFCTPSGRVIHSVVGPVRADELLEEAQWALDVYEPVKSEPLHIQMDYVAKAHLESFSAPASWAVNALRNRPWRHGGSKQTRVHQLLGAKPLAPLAKVYQEIFQGILGQKVSNAAPNLALADRLLTRAEEQGRPLLFVIHREYDNARGYDKWLKFVEGGKVGKIALRALLRDYVVVLIPSKEQPALSQRLGRPPYEAPSRKSPLFVIARSNGEQLGAAAGYDDTYRLGRELAHGWVAAAEESLPTVRKLRQTRRLLVKVDPDLDDDFEGLIEKSQAKAKAKLDRLASAR